MEETTLEVTGMACDGCEATVVEALEGLEGVSSVTADHEENVVHVEHDEATVDETTVSKTIEAAGYEVAT